MKKKVALVLNLLLIIFEILGFTIAFKTGEVISPMFYTEDSNLICLIASLLYVFYFFKGKENNKVVNFLRFVTTLNLVITFIITLFVLAPDLGYVDMMIKNEFIFFHSICPVLSLVSYLFFEKYRFNKNNKFLIKAPALSMIYGAVVYTLNLLKIINGPYDFLKVYEHTIPSTLLTFLGMTVGMFVLTFTLLETKKKIKI